MRYGFETTDASTYQLLIDKSKEMRNHPTEAESLMWKYLSGNKIGVHFRRQHPVFGYIPDFVCLSHKLIIEIDGGYHLKGEQPEKDKERTHWLNQQGYIVLRFTNDEVLQDIEEVLTEISETLQSQSTTEYTPSPIPSAPKSIKNPSHGEGHRVGSIFRIGFGYDVHQLVEGRDLWLGGIKIDYAKGLLGHSDADVLIHAICDALLGAANMRDIGYHFPDTSADTEGMDSKVILRETIRLIATKGYSLGNIDATVCAEQPKLNPHIPAMQQCMADIIGTDPDNISIKATTTERLGFTGRQEGIAAYATALIVKE
jgi:2-C-methyl-D-erythritol 2,4-cyclodiphosphate synthase